jgi:hypothetical protein
MSSPLVQGAALRTFENLDGKLRDWALGEGSDEAVCPVLIEATTLARAGYPDAFPHLLMSAVVATSPANPLEPGNLALPGWHLSPAVCYHVFASLGGCVISEGRVLTSRGHCFRNEVREQLVLGRRQIEFQMREVVLVGAAEWIESRLGRLQAGIDTLAAAHGLTTTWCPASDPFFLPRAQGKAHMQRILGTKLELCLPDGLAITSINRHGTFFGERFGISLSDGASAHSACVAFGLDRWAAHAAVTCL